MYLLSLIFNIYVVLFSALFPFVHSVYLALFSFSFFLFCCASFSFPIKFYIYMRELTQLSPIPDLGVYKDRREEERWGMGWGVTLPLFGCFEGERIWGDFIISWVEADLLSVNGKILWVFLLYWFVVESHYNWDFSHAHFQSSIVVVDCLGKKLRIADWKHYCLKWNHSTLKAWIIFMVIESIRQCLFAIHIKS